MKSSHDRNARTRVLALVCFCLGASLAACSGGSSSSGGGVPVGNPPRSTPTPVRTQPPTPTPTPTSVGSPTPTPSPTPSAVTLDPPAITFTQSGPNDYIVTVSGGSGTYTVPGAGDTCTPQGFATWEQLSSKPNEYDVTYGINTGSCVIEFQDAFHPSNYSFLQVTNNHNPH